MFSKHPPTTTTSPLILLRSQAGPAHQFPWGGETKIIIGSSLSLTAFCSSHIWSILRWRAAAARGGLFSSAADEVIHKMFFQGSGTFGAGREDLSGVRGEAAAEEERQWWLVGHYSALITLMWSNLSSGSSSCHGQPIICAISFEAPNYWQHRPHWRGFLRFLCSP